MKRILICYDKSDYSRKALNIGLTIAKGTNRELVVLFVRSTHEKKFIEEENASDAEIKNQVKEMMKKTITTLIRSKVRAEGVILKGDTATKIIEYSEENNIDLIIMGALGIGDTGVFKLGSVAEKVSRYSKKPVLITR